MTDPFALLGLTPGASPGAVRAAYRTRARAAHPDVPGGSADAFDALYRVYQAAIQEASEWPCDACGGDGAARVGRGFGAIRVACAKCGGSGRRWG